MMFTVFVENVAENFRVVDGLGHFESVALGAKRSTSEVKAMHGSVNVRIDLWKQDVDSDQAQGGHEKDEQQRQEMPTFDPSALWTCQLNRGTRVLHGGHRDEVFIQ
jgi:hypothetical protein